MVGGESGAGGGPAIEIARLAPGDRDRWERLFRAYIDFYERSEPDAMYERAWRLFGDDEIVHALGARAGGELVGIVHFLVHANTSARDVCYLQDLFTAPEARGCGVGRALIAAVAEWAGERGCGRVYWLTHETNATARRLYDDVAVHSGFIRYELAL